MKASDQDHKWVEWSEEDQTYIGKCPDLLPGIHGDDPVRRYTVGILKPYSDSGCLITIAYSMPNTNRSFG